MPSLSSCVHRRLREEPRLRRKLQEVRVEREQLLRASKAVELLVTGLKKTFQQPLDKEPPLRKWQSQHLWYNADIPTIKTAINMPVDDTHSLAVTVIVFQDKPPQKQVQLFSHLPQYERTLPPTKSLEYAIQCMNWYIRIWLPPCTQLCCREHTGLYCEARSAVLWGHHLWL